MNTLLLGLILASASAQNNVKKQDIFDEYAATHGIFYAAPPAGLGDGSRLPNEDCTIIKSPFINTNKIDKE